MGISSDGEIVGFDVLGSVHARRAPTSAAAHCGSLAPAATGAIN
jgi:hypothetical protein